jgi:hypothetical protein
MAERRMFAKTIVLSDAFLDMPLSSRCLYFTLSMFADDDGFVNGPKSIIRQCGAAEDDLNILVAKRFMLPFESGVIVIKHWRINNYLRNDRYTPTKYTDEKELLSVDENGAYSDHLQSGIPSSGIPSIGKVRLDKVSIGKESIGDKGGKSNRFEPPTLSEVSDYCTERKNSVDPQRFIDHYTSNGWMVGKTKMKDWKASVRTWEKTEKSYGKPKQQPAQQKNYSGGENFTDFLR